MFFKKRNFYLFCFITVLFSNTNWSQTGTPPTITATGNQVYCPLSEQLIVTDFNITNPANTTIDALFIQISTDYSQGEDILKLTGTHPNINALPFNSAEGKLVLEWIGSSQATNYSDLIAAVKAVIFESSSTTISGIKTFSFNIDDANYLPSTQHYYEYVANVGITWNEAKTAAETRNYYGLQGYLATITSSEEAQLTGEQAAGAGWIGGSDEEIEGTWKWVTGPEAGMIFWNGVADGSSPPGVYSNWNTREPNNYRGDENYAHITDPTIGIVGAWNDLPNIGGTNKYIPQGYLVEYGGMPGDPILNISASTKIYIPTIDVVNNGENCGTNTVTLSANASAGSVIWFDVASGGTVLFTGNTFTTPLLSTSKTYYVAASENGCTTGLRTAIIATIKTIPTITATTNTTICGAGSSILSATASAGIINWYATATGGTALSTGTTFTTPVISITTTYYVAATENGCTTLTRTPVTLNVQYVNAPSLTSPQEFCDVENATLADLTVSGTAILWYANAVGGTALNSSEILVNNTNYYASQTINGCESQTRIAVNTLVSETVVPLLPSEIPTLEECDNATDGDDTNGFSIFNLTANNTILLNGKNASDFTFSYFTDASFSAASLISSPTTFENTVINEQTIYVRILNNLHNSCFSDTSFNIQVHSLPIIQATVTLKNCDEDGISDGFTDFNLTEANYFITNGDSSLMVSYYLTLNDANLGGSPINPSPFNNKNAINNEVFARVENNFNCYRISTVTLEVSTTSFPTGYLYNLETCDADTTIDGFESFDLTQASTEMLAQFPAGQNLTVHYFRNSTDAQLEQNEILPQNNYTNEVAFSQVLFVRVESEDNGDCFGIGPHVTLIVNPRPQFIVKPYEIVCLNLPPITLFPVKTQGNYSYEWFNENGTIISNNPTVQVSKGSVYTVVATSSFGCESFPKTITVSESIIASIGLDDVTITDDSDNNTVTINNQNNNLGIGAYEFSLDDVYGPYQDESFFDNVAAGIHTIYVHDKNNCGVASLEISVIGFPRFFTPNNDGFNDTWQIKGVNDTFYPTSLIYIFDRFGKLITQINPTTEGWNGIFNGEQLPASDYWFSVQLIDENGNIREKKGHFSLVR